MPITKKMPTNYIGKVMGLVYYNPIVVFSKSNCRNCVKVKELFSQMGVKFTAIELDQESDDQLQVALVWLTGQESLPNVFISGTHFGDYDAIMALHNEGKLALRLTQAGAVA